MAKTLYFEGAGVFGSIFGELGNPRLRTAFTAANGKRCYLEVCSSIASKEQRKCRPELHEISCAEGAGGRYGWVDSCHWLTDDPKIDDAHENRNKELAIHEPFTFTHEGLLRLVNERIGASFDSVEVAPQLAGYRVFNGGGKRGTLGYFAYGDEFVCDEESTKRAEAIYEREVQRQKDAGEKSPCVSAWRDERDPMILHVIHHRKGFKSFDTRID